MLKLLGSGVTVTAKQTEPPPYYNEASLVKKLEEEGIGRPSTYAEIISKVQARDYVKKVNNKLVPSELGKLVIERLVADSFDLADLELHAQAGRRPGRGRRSARQAARRPGAVPRPPAEEDRHKPRDKGKWWPEPEAIDEKCPECGKELDEALGPQRRASSAATVIPDCKYTRALPGDGDDGEDGGDRRPQLTDYKCELCGAR